MVDMADMVEMVGIIKIIVLGVGVEVDQVIEEIKVEDIKDIGQNQNHGPQEADHILEIPDIRKDIIRDQALETPIQDHQNQEHIPVKGQMYIILNRKQDGDRSFFVLISEFYLKFLFD